MCECVCVCVCVLIFIQNQYSSPEFLFATLSCFHSLPFFLYFPGKFDVQERQKNIENESICEYKGPSGAEGK